MCQAGQHPQGRFGGNRRGDFLLPPMASESVLLLRCFHVVIRKGVMTGYKEAPCPFWPNIIKAKKQTNS